MQQELNLSEYWHILLKRKWVIVFTFLFLAGSTALLTESQTRVYQTYSMVRIDQYKTVMNVISDLLRWSPGEIMSTEVETAQSPLVLEKVAERMGMISPGMGNEKKSQVVADLRSKITAERVERTNMIKITVTSSNASEVSRLANLTAEVYGKVSQENKAQDVRASRKFVEDQLEKARRRLSKSEEALRSFKEQYGSLSVDSETQITLDRLTGFEGDLLTTRKEIEETNWEIVSIKDRLKNSDLDREMNEQQPSAISSLYTKLLDVRSRIDTLLNDYTETSPDITELRAEEKRTFKHLAAALKSNLKTRIDGLQQHNADLRKREAELTQLVNNQLALVPDKDLELSRLTREVSMNEELYQMLNREFKEAQIKEMGMVSEVTLVSPAVTPRKPIKPNKNFNYMIGIMLGLIIGLVMAALVESFDTSIGAVEDIERLLDVPVLTAVPRFSKTVPKRNFPSLRKTKTTANEPVDYSLLLPTIFNPSSAAAEAYRHLRTNLQFSRLKEERKVYLFTSSGSQEGKSVTVSNLAVTLAQSGMRTLLLGCNLRRPTEYKIFGIKRIPGLSDVLIGSARLEEAVHTFADIVLGEMKWEAALRLPGIDNLSILPAGTLPPNPAELLESKKMKDLLDSLRRQYDIILIDAPPTLPVTDSLLLGTIVDGVILVYQLGHLPRRALIRAKKLMDSLGVHVIGIVLNDVRPEFQGVTPVYISQEYMKATKKVMSQPEEPMDRSPEQGLRHDED
jgi:capsular exopolysaccharide synthesis family protein